MRRRTRRGAGGRRRTRRSAAATNFYRHTNRRWLATTRIPATEARILNSYFVDRHIQHEIAQILDTPPAGPIADLLASWDRLTENEATTATGLTPLLQIALSMETRTDVAQRIGWMNRANMGAPIRVYVWGDLRDHTRCRINIEAGEPAIGTPEYWLEPQYAGHRRNYAAYVRRLAELLRMPALEAALPAEREFANIYPSARERSRSKRNLLSWAELTGEFPAVDWRALFIAYGIPADRLDTLRYNVSSLPFLHRLQHRVTTWPIERWQGWFAAATAQWAAGQSPHGALRRAWFAYNRRYRSGVNEDVSAAALRTYIVQACLPDTLGRLWVKRFCTEALKRDVTRMAERIRTAAENTVEKTSWLAPSTKLAALRKLRRMEFQIGWPDPWPASTLPDSALDPEDFYGNLLALAAHGTDRNTALLTDGGGCRDPSRKFWTQPVYIVNAFYSPEENRLTIPAGILRPPYYSAEMSVPAKYASTGATIGHEICHGFDSEGRLFDERGDKHNWWTKGDADAYRARAAQVVHLFESEPFMGRDVDGRLTLTENIADLAGMEFALAGAQAELGRALTKEELREFFTSYSVSWRSKVRARRAAELLTTDYHAPPELRVNHTVRQFDEWYDAFDVGPDSPGYLPPERRVRFFR